MIKRLSILMLIVLLLSLVVVGCGGGNSDTGSGESSEENQQQKQSSDALKVAALLPGPISDQGWNMIMYQGLKTVEEELGAEIAYSEQVPPSDYEEIFRGYATQGYNIVVGHGFEFGDAAKKVASQFPDTIFVVTSTDISQEPNVASLNTDNLEQGFLQGIVAGLITKSNMVAAVGGMEIPPIIDSLNGFKIGAEYVNPDVIAKTAMTGSFEDAAKAKEMANALIDEGADVVMADADQAGLGVIEAAEDAGILAIGANGDQSGLAPDTIVTSGIDNLAFAFKVFVDEYLADNFESKAYVMGVAEGAVKLAPFHDFENSLPKETMDKINQIVEDVKNGKIDVHKMAEESK